MVVDLICGWLIVDSYWKNRICKRKVKLYSFLLSPLDLWCPRIMVADWNCGWLITDLYLEYRVCCVKLYRNYQNIQTIVFHYSYSFLSSPWICDAVMVPTRRRLGSFSKRSVGLDTLIRFWCRMPIVEIPFSALSPSIRVVRFVHSGLFCISFLLPLSALYVLSQTDLSVDCLILPKRW